MPVFYVPQHRSRRILSSFSTLTWRFNEAVLVPYRLLMWLVHCSALMCAARGSDGMILVSSLARGYDQKDYVFLRQATDLCLATSFLCLFFTMWGVVTGRTLRFGLANAVQGTFHCIAGVLLLVVWHNQSHVARIWQVFYIFSVIPTALEALTLLYSYRKGIDFYC